MRVAIIGGGVAGLSLCNLLDSDSAFEVKLFEAKDHPGGWIQTETASDYLFDVGPRGCQPAGCGGIFLHWAERLGLKDQVIPSDSRARKRYLYYQEELHTLPYKLHHLLLNPLARSFISKLAREWQKSPGRSHPTVREFLKNRLGLSNRDELLFAIDAFCLGVYGTHASELSAQRCLPTLLNYEREHGSILKGFLRNQRKKKSYPSSFSTEIKTASVCSFKGGMKPFIEALHQHSFSSVELNQRADKVEVGKKIKLEMGRERWEADYVVMAIPPRQALNIKGNWVEDSLRQSLVFDHTSMILVQLGFQELKLSERLRSFGYLVPQGGKGSVIGGVLDSCVFPDQNNWKDQGRITLMIQADQERSKTMKVTDWVDLGKRSLKKQLGILQEPDYERVSVLSDALPLYSLEYERHLEDLHNHLIKHKHSLSFLGMGSSCHSVNDSLSGAYELYEKLKNEMK